MKYSDVKSSINKVITSLSTINASFLLWSEGVMFCGTALLQCMHGRWLEKTRLKNALNYGVVLYNRILQDTSRLILGF